MRVLVAIAHHGDKNREHLLRVLATYERMSSDVDVVVLTEVHKPLPEGVEQRVGVPTRDPWSLPFGHRRLFADRRSSYDLYVYSEDDVLITEENLRAFVSESHRVATDEIPGFLRYEVTPGGERFFPDLHSGYHWVPTSLSLRPDGLYAAHSNPHSASYALTREHLEHCLAAGSFLVPAHRGRVDLLVAAATDPYTSCGLRRILPIDRLESFLVHHLPNNYVGRLGTEEPALQLQLDALAKVARTGDTDRLLEPRTTLDVETWDKSFHDPVPPPLAHLPVAGSSVLSVGVGYGEIEGDLIDRGATVYGIPHDAITAEVAAHRGVIPLPADVPSAVAQLRPGSIDLVVLVDVLGRMPDPVSALRQLRRVAAPGCHFLVTTRNQRYDWLRWLLGRGPRPPMRGAFAVTGMEPADAGQLHRWLGAAGMASTETCYWTPRSHEGPRPTRHWPLSATHSEVVVIASDDGPVL